MNLPQLQNSRIFTDNLERQFEKNTQERKEDGSQPRDTSSPATQRNNHGEVA